MTPDALRSLIGQGEREQEVLTPPRIIDALLRLWPSGIALDPCAPTDPAKRLVPAAQFYDGVDGDGLRDPWLDHTYANPPYDDLARWLAKGLREAHCGRIEVVELVPARTHREWFDLAAWDRVCLLRPLRFVGFANDFPAPLVALYAGTRPEAFDAAFGHLGRCGSFDAAAPVQVALW